MAYRLRLFANVNLMQKWDLLRTFNNIFFFFAQKSRTNQRNLWRTLRLWIWENSVLPVFRTEQRLLWKGKNWSAKVSVDSVSVLLNSI